MTSAAHSRIVKDSTTARRGGNEVPGHFRLLPLSCNIAAWHIWSLRALWAHAEAAGHRGMEVDMKRFLFVAAVGMLATSGAALADDASEIAARNRDLVDAFKKGDAAAIARLYADDAVLLPEGSDTVTGKADIEKFWQSALDQVGNVTLATKTLTNLAPDIEVETGEVGFTTKEDEPEAVTGKYLVIWKKAGGDWKIASDMWNETNGDNGDNGGQDQPDMSMPGLPDNPGSGSNDTKKQ
jgi:uncharacterized protein (TIGR02246 family)